MADVEIPTEPIRSIWLIPTAQFSYNRPGTYRAYSMKHLARTQARKIGAQVLRIDLWLNKPPLLNGKTLTKKTEILAIFHETNDTNRAAMAIVSKSLGGSFLNHAEPSMLWVSDLPLLDELPEIAGELKDLESVGVTVKSINFREVAHDAA